MELSFYFRSWTVGYSCADIMRDFSQPFNKHIHQLEVIASDNHSENSICFYQELFGFLFPLRLKATETIIWIKVKPFSDQKIIPGFFSS